MEVRTIGLDYFEIGLLRCVWNMLQVSNQLIRSWIAWEIHLIQNMFDIFERRIVITSKDKWEFRFVFGMP